MNCSLWHYFIFLLISLGFFKFKACQLYQISMYVYSNIQNGKHFLMIIEVEAKFVLLSRKFGIDSCPPNNTQCIKTYPMHDNQRDFDKSMDGYIYVIDNNPPLFIVLQASALFILVQRAIHSWIFIIVQIYQVQTNTYKLVVIITINRMKIDT